MKLLSSLLPKSMSSRLMIVILLATLLPTMIVGWVAVNAVFEITAQNKINDVGLVADNRHEQLKFTLDQVRMRARLFLLNQLDRCQVVAGQSSAATHACLKSALTSFLKTESALGGVVFFKGVDTPLSVGVAANVKLADLKLLPGQLAIFPAAKNQAARVYYVPVSDEQQRVKLVLIFPVSLIQEIFHQPRALGQSGETFLSDAQGFFITRPRYPSKQGVSVEISAMPMRSCLQKHDMEMLELDYRAAPIIHGFRYVPEIGGGCIMAHIDQKEAFAPLEKLKLKVTIFALLLGAMGVMLAMLLSRQLSRPLNRLSESLAKIELDSEHIGISEEGPSEIVALAAAFKGMLERLNYSSRKLSESKQQAQEDQEKLSGLVNSAMDAIISMDEQQHITLFNRAAEQVFGYRASEIIGQPIDKLIPRSFSSRTCSAGDRIRQDGYDGSQHRCACRGFRLARQRGRVPLRGFNLAGGSGG